MLGFQTLSCLHDIPVVRSSTDKLQDVYAKAKDTSVFIRFPCNLVETVADKSLKFALTLANPFIKPLREPVRLIDDYAVQKIRQIESKYPVINTSTEDVVNSFNEKTEPVRHVMNSVKDTTTSTIQHGKETVSNVATATVNKASGVADSVFSFCETHVPGIQRRNTGRQTGLNGFVFLTVGSLLNYVLQLVSSSLIWFRMLVVFFLLKTKQMNDVIINKIQQKPFLTALPQRLLIIVGAFLEYFIGQIRPDDRTLAELKKTKQQSRFNQQPNYFANRQSSKPDSSVKTRQSVVVTKQQTVVTRVNDHSNSTDREELYTRLANSGLNPSGYNDEFTTERVNHITNGDNINSRSQPDYSDLTDKEELYARLANSDLRSSMYNVDNDAFTTEPVDLVASGDIAQLHARLNPSDVELLYARLPGNVLPVVDNQEPLNKDQQQLHARIIGAGLERQGYPVNEDGN